MRQILTLLFLCMSVACLYAQSASKSDPRTPVIKIEGNQNGLIKSDNDASGGISPTTLGTENVSFKGTAEGIYVTVISGTNKIKLFALTGQLLFNGEMTQGQFLIKTRNGIYFLKINNKSFKVFCR